MVTQYLSAFDLLLGRSEVFSLSTEEPKPLPEENARKLLFFSAPEVAMFRAFFKS